MVTEIYDYYYLGFLQSPHMTFTKNWKPEIRFIIATMEAIRSISKGVKNIFSFLKGGGGDRADDVSNVFPEG
jgi:hypothetical protein